jgi:hypothetical protein
MVNHYQLKISTSNLSSLFFVKTFILSFFPTFKVIFLPKKQKKFVFIRSPHVNSKSKEHFKITKYQRLYIVKSSIESLNIFLSKTPNDLNIIVKKVNF